MLTQPLPLSSIKVLTDLVRGVARFAIDIQVLKDLKRHSQVNDSGPHHPSVLPFCSLRSPDLKQGKTGGSCTTGRNREEAGAHGLHCAIKVLTDLVRGVARLSIDMQVLTDLKRHSQVNDTGPNHPSVLPFCSLRSPDLKHKARPGGLALQRGKSRSSCTTKYKKYPCFLTRNMLKFVLS